MTTMKALTAPRRLLTLLLLLVGIVTASGGCIVVPVGGYGGPRHPAVFAPAPVVVVRPYRGWWY